MLQFIKGNNISLEWEILTDGEPVSLEGREIEVYVVCDRFRRDMDVTVDGNVLSFTFFGIDQPFDGVYDLELIIDRDTPNQERTYEESVFEIVDSVYKNLYVSSEIYEY